MKKLNHHQIMRRLEKNDFVIHVSSTYLDPNLSDIYVSKIFYLHIQQIIL